MKIKIVFSFVVVFLCGLYFISSSVGGFHKERLAIDNVDIGEDDEIMLHLRNNIWVKGNAVFTDENGLYTFDKNLTKSKNADDGWGYVKHWKCPYCYMYWPVGQRCGNTECPSKY